MAIEWSQDQIKVIDTRQKNLLVSAAAGSGKTAVLVERVIRMITDPEEPLDVERLLIVTFTKAAAAEMRERIKKGIGKRLEASPEDHRLIRQSLLVDYAQISTIHSLCLKLIREHFDVLDMDPAFGMADENTIKLLKDEAAEDIMEAYYTAGNEAFLNLCDAYSRGRRDDAVKEMMLSLYEKSMSHPDPDYWLNQCVHVYEEKGEDILLFLMDEIHTAAEKVLPLLGEMKELAMEDGDEGLIKVAESDTAKVKALITSETLSDALDGVREKWMTLPRMKKGVEKSPARERLEALRKDVKTAVDKLKNSFPDVTADYIAREYGMLLPHVKTLTELVRSFRDHFDMLKDERKIKDYNDLEHLALKLLVTFEIDDEQQLIAKPTRVADELAAYYQEIICDEYQDSNQVQETILSALSSGRLGKADRFMVGDVKQSIYGFRQADPSIFLEKYGAYGDDGQDRNMRIDLSKNFRSRAEVLDSINFFFRRLMAGRPGGIVYDEAAALHCGAYYPEDGHANGLRQTELMLVNYDKDSLDNEDTLISNAELEAHAVAKRIKALTDPEFGLDIYDGELGSYRKAGYDDIVILFRSVKSWAQPFADILSQHNIPAQAELTSGFFDTTEIRTMVALLQIIYNPDQDIPLAGVMLSPIGGMTEEDLALMRGELPKASLLKAYRQYRDRHPEAIKLQQFDALLNRLRKAAAYMELQELLRLIFSETHYDDLVLAMPAGERRRANLDLLISHAENFSAGGMSTLFGFVNYIAQIREREIDFGEAETAADHKGRVRIMTIHKSKGLEFPVVFLSGLGKGINEMDIRASMVVHPKTGIGLDLVSTSKRKKAPSLRKRLIKSCLKEDLVGEELRVLYVAMTRAKEKLIMTGSFSGPEKQLETWQKKACREEPALPRHVIMEAGSWLDWIMPCLMDSDAMNPLRDLYHISHKIKEDPEAGLFKIYTETVQGIIDAGVAQESLARWGIEGLERVDHDPASPVIQSLERDAAWQYPDQELLNIRGKYSVSELKAGDYTAPDDPDTPEMLVPEEMIISEKDLSLPSFMQVEKKNTPSKLKGNERGTAYHKVMELIDFASIPETVTDQWVRQQMLSMKESGKLSENQYESVNEYDILTCLDSEIGRRMKAADGRGQLYKESQFVMRVPISMVDENIHRDEKVLVQGIIDLWFIEDDEIVLLDYKTDRVFGKDADTLLWQHYGRQLDYYAYALEHIQGKKVKEKGIYAFNLSAYLQRNGE